MPYLAALPSADRFFARLDRFECECPSCGKVMFAAFDLRSKNAKFQSAAETRHYASRHPKSDLVKRLIWNPVSQRLACPNCQAVYCAGLLLYPMEKGRQRLLDPPPDCVPTKRQKLELRRTVGGFWLHKKHRDEDEVNVVVTNPCTCPPKGWAVACPIHGDPEQAAGGGRLAPVDSAELGKDAV